VFDLSEANCIWVIHSFSPDFVFQALIMVAATPGNFYPPGKRSEATIHSGAT
jgi:hypothetical protein